MSKRFSKKIESATKATGVRYFDQFMKNCVRHYGPTDKAPSDATILKRLKPFNCELFSRPKIGMSELSASIGGPLEAIAEEKCELEKVEELKKLSKSLKPFIGSLEGFNTRKGEESGEGKKASEKDVKEVLKLFLKEEEGLDVAMCEAFVVGSNLLTMSTNYLVARALFRNPDEYGEMSAIEGEAGKSFKKAGSIKVLKELLKKTCVGEAVLEKKAVKKREQLYLELESSDEEAGGVVSGELEKKKKKKQKKRKRVVEEEEEQEKAGGNEGDVKEEAVEEEVVVEKKKKAKKHRRGRDI